MRACRVLSALAAILTLAMSDAPARAEICLSVIPEDPDIGLHERRMFSYDAPEFAGFFVRGTDKAWVFDGERLKRRPQGQDVRRPPENTFLETDHPAATSPDGLAVAVGSANGRAALFAYDPTLRRFEPLEGEIGVRRPGDIIWSDIFDGYLVAGSNGIFLVRVDDAGIVSRQIVGEGISRFHRLLELPALETVILGGYGRGADLLESINTVHALGTAGISPLSLPTSRRGVGRNLSSRSLAAISDPPVLLYDEIDRSGRTIGYRAVVLAGKGSAVTVADTIPFDRGISTTFSDGLLIRLSGGPQKPVTLDGLRRLDDGRMRPFTLAELGPLAALEPKTKLKRVRGVQPGLYHAGDIYLFDAGRLTLETRVPDLNLPPDESRLLSFQTSKTLGLTFMRARTRSWLHEHGGETVELTDPDPNYALPHAYFIVRHGETIIDTGNRRLLATIREICPADAD